MNTGPANGTCQQQQAKVPGPTLPVIAVFGGAKDEPTREAAEQIGKEIGLSQAILLTGGDDPKAKDLKGRVLAGANRAREGGAAVPWISVVRKKLALDPEFVDDGLSLVLTPGGRHLRNYAEAEFCDAAIAFKGEIGTSSEVVFCLALGKPLVLVGDPWPSKYPMVSGTDARKLLKKDATDRVSLRPAHPCLGPLIIKAYERFDRVVEPFFQHFALPPKTPPSAVVEAAIRAAKASGPPRRVGRLSERRSRSHSAISRVAAEQTMIKSRASHTGWVEIGRGQRGTAVSP
jgi:predicted Rossmann-fold nucleotide-binding protein